MQECAYSFRTSFSTFLDQLFLCRFFTAWEGRQRLLLNSKVQEELNKKLLGTGFAGTEGVDLGDHSY